MFKFFSSILSILFVIVFSFSVQAQSNNEIEVIGVKMDAEWCGKCQVMNPKLDNIYSNFKNEPVLFIKFNMTDNFTVQQSAMLADRLNLNHLFEENKGQTGYMVLVNAQTNEVLETLHSDLSEEEIESKIRSVLKNVRS